MDSEFAPTRAMVLSEMSMREKEKYYSLLLRNESKFFQDEHGNYIASVRVLAPGMNKRVGDQQAGEPGRNAHEEYLKHALLLPYEERMLFIEHQTEGASSYVECGHFQYPAGLKIAVAQGSLDFNFVAYPRFTTLIADMGDIVRPKTRILSWIMKIIEDIYDARFAQESGEDGKDKVDGEQKDGDTTSDRGNGKSKKISMGSGSKTHMQIFPVFVVRRLSMVMGLKKVVDQNSWDLLANIDRLRKDYLEVEVFARFLQELYDQESLLFYLYVRSVVSTTLHINFKNKWTRTDSANPKNQQNLWMSFRECVQVSRIVYGQDREEATKSFVALVREYVGVMFVCLEGNSSVLLFYVPLLLVQ